MDPFAVLGIDRSFDVDLKEAEKKHRDLSRALHPDKYAGAGASERMLALGRAVEVNESWRVVRDPVRRAEALFTLAEIAVGETNEPKPSAAFLMDILEQREALAEAKAKHDVNAIDALESEIEERVRGVHEALSAGFAAARGESAKLASLVPRLGELRFYRRFLEEVSAIEDEMIEGTGHGASRNL
jgi:molecular chaperone HscB